MIERFDAYMDRCLYDEDAGFYARHGEAGGSRGDFVTSPEVGPLFGAVLARALDAWWVEQGRPATFTVVEAAAGRGALAAAILRAEPECSAALDYVTVERSARLREAQAALLGDRVTIAADLDEVCDGAPFAGVVLANELLDNLAFRWVARVDGAWCEVMVDDGVPTTAPLAGPVVAALPDVPDEASLPLCEQAHDWVAGALARLTAGRVVAIDYGVATSQELVGRQWLRTYRGHERGGDPFEAPGRCDITCDVPFDQLPAATSISTQAEFLTRHGIDELVDEGRRIWTERAHLGDLEAIRARSRVTEAEALLAPDGLGAFLVGEWVRPEPA
ncbi:MAG: SAM-dependent methyltransferase [Acidimicrobiales bacterium]